MNLAALNFEPIHSHSGLPKRSAVYVVMGPDMVPLYIGESVRLRIRWQGHKIKPAAIALGADRIGWVAVPEARRLAVERWLIREYQPILNTAGTPRDRRLSAYRRPGPKPRKPTPPDAGA